jgi:hypothetical protein
MQLLPGYQVCPREGGTCYRDLIGAGNPGLLPTANRSDTNAHGVDAAGEAAVRQMGEHRELCALDV